MSIQTPSFKGSFFGTRNRKDIVLVQIPIIKSSIIIKQFHRYKKLCALDAHSSVKSNKCVSRDALVDVCVSRDAHIVCQQFARTIRRRVCCNYCSGITQVRVKFDQGCVPPAGKTARKTRNHAIPAGHCCMNVTGVPMCASIRERERGKGGGDGEGVDREGEEMEVARERFLQFLMTSSRKHKNVNHRIA